MKIAHFSVGIYHKGGIASYIRSLTALQIAAGDEVFQFEIEPTAAPPGCLPAILVADEIALFRRCAELGIDLLHYHTGPKESAPPGMPVVYTVHEHSPHCISGGLFLKRRSLPCPRTYNILGCAYGHLWDHCGSLRPNNFLTHLHRVKSQMAILPTATTIAIGHFLKEKMLAAGYPGTNIFVVPNFTTMNEADTAIPPAEVPEFLYLGRLEKLKGVDWLLRSFARAKAPAVLNIGGQGDAEAGLKGLAAELGIADRVRFLGWIDSNAKSRLLKTTRALVVPSIWPEPFGLVTIEAAAAGRPVIVSDTGELPFIIRNGENGIVVKVGAIEPLTAAIENLARDLPKARKMGLNNRERYLGIYTAEIHKQNIDEVYLHAQALSRQRSALPLKVS